MKLRHEPTPVAKDELPPQSVDSHPSVEPLAILDVKTVTEANKSVIIVLVMWQGLSPDETSWEDCNTLFSLYNLENNVCFDGHGNVICTPVIDTYYAVSSGRSK